MTKVFPVFWLLIGAFIGALLVAWFFIDNQISIDQDTIIAASAVIIAACALGLTWWQAHSSQRHNKLSVKPHLILKPKLNGEDREYRIRLVNNGLGPAFITSFTSYLDGDKLTDTKSMLNTIIETLFEGKVALKSMDAVDGQSVIPAGKHIELIKVCLDKHLVKNDADLKNFIISLENRVRFEIEYKSIYGVEDTLNDHI